MTFMYQEEQPAFEACVREALEHLLDAHPEARGTLLQWVEVQREAQKKLDFRLPNTFVGERNQGPIARPADRARQLALNLLEGVSIS